MIIRSMNANFGALSNAELELRPGLNVIQAPNESGKSTWCAFLRVMLYGPESVRGARSGRLPDKERYAPWDGSPMWGRMELTWRDRELTLERGPSPAGPMRGFSAVYSGTAQPVEGMTDSDAGELLTGMTLDMFRRTAFIGPAGLAVTQGPELEKRIASTLSSGEEGVAYSQADARLRAWQRRLRYRGQGRLPELEAQIADTRARLTEAEALRARLTQIDADVRDAASRQEALQAGAAHPAQRETERLRQQRELLELEGEILRREGESETLRRSLRESPLHGAGADEALLAAAGADARRAGKLRKELSGRPASRWPWIALLAAAAVLCALGLLRHLFLLPAAACLLAGGALAFVYEQNRSRRRSAARELGEILDRYGVTAPRQIVSVAESYAERRQELNSLLTAAEELRAAARGLSRTLAAAPDASPRAEEPALRETQEQLKALWTERAGVQARLGGLGDPEELRRRLSELEEEQTRLSERLAALELAAEELSAADGEMNARFAPALSRRTQELFARLTGERYDEVALSRELRASLRRSGEGVARPDAFASSGTRDQLYLALRLALCATAPPGEEPCPVILDDALVTFDDERMGLALDLLGELARERQILLFTCQSRERRYLGI